MMNARQVQELITEMLAALKQVHPMADTLMDELAKKKATDWAIVNKCLCDVRDVISKVERAR